MELPRSFVAVGDDYFCDTVPVKKDVTANNEIILQAVIQKRNELIRTAKSIIYLTNRKTEMEEDYNQHIKLAEELIKEKRKQFLKEKQRQLLRENNHELKELEGKLRAAYVAKSIKLQIAEKEALKRQEALLKKQEDELLEKAIQKDNEFIRQEIEEENKKKERLRKNLRDQIAVVRQQRQKLYEEFLKEKKIFDEIASKIQEEELEEMRREIEKKALYRSDIENFLRIQAAWKEQQKKDMQEEDERLRKYFEQKEVYSREKDEKRKQEIVSKQKISEKIGQEISQITAEKLKREEVLWELYAAEKQANEDQKLRKQIEERFRKRIQLRKELEEHKNEIILRKQREQDEDKVFYEEQMRIFAERDKIDQMSDEKRRRKIIEHRQELRKCLEEKKIRKAQEIALLIKQREQEIQEEKTRQQLIEEERINLLKEHVTNLLGYLPPGILRESDREFLALPKRN